MALQDLTPQLRTRMTRVERLVGFFVLFAALLMLSGFGYYLKQTGKKRGWFVRKIPYYCYVADATGLKAGDPVRMLGREVGRITVVDSTPPSQWFMENHYNIFIKFDIWDPYYGYIWTDSRVKLMTTDFFGPRYLEVTRGVDELVYPTVVENKDRIEDSLVINDKFPDNGEMTNRIKLSQSKEGVWLKLDETPTLAQRGEEIVLTVAKALPVLTNQVFRVLVQAELALSNANISLAAMPPMVTNLQGLAQRLGSEEGVIGRMLLTTNLQAQVSTTLFGMDATLTNTAALIRTSEMQLQDLTRRIAMTLDNVSLITSNLGAQVNANSLMLGEVSSLVVNADDMVQGLKRHWLLRSAFAGATNPPIESVVLPSLDQPGRSPGRP